MVRGINKSAIFKDEQDKTRFMERRNTMNNQWTNKGRMGFPCALCCVRAATAKAVEAILTRPYLDVCSFFFVEMPKG